MLLVSKNMSILLSQNSKMGSPFLLEFKRQASFFLKEKIKTARLALTDVTLAELLTEEATDGDIWPPDTRTMGVISRAAFEVDDYWRIVDILHKRLTIFDRKCWRVSHKTLLLLEHLLTHGPLRLPQEFLCDKDVIKEMGSFQFVDEKGFNWGSSVRNLSNRILNLLENEVFLKEERARARELTRGIQGFGSFFKRSTSDHKRDSKGIAFRTFQRSNSNYSYHVDTLEDGILESNEKLLNLGRFQEAHVQGEIGLLEKQEEIEKDACVDHPFCDNDYQTTSSLLSE